MKRRIRKKLRTGEFREYSFAVVAALAPSVTEEEACRTCDDFLEVLTKHGLCFGGLIFPSWDGIVAFVGRGSASELHPMVVRGWLCEQPPFESFQVGELVDAWH